MSDLSRIDREALDRHIIGGYGADQYRETDSDGFELDPWPPCNDSHQWDWVSSDDGHDFFECVACGARQTRPFDG